MQDDILWTPDDDAFAHSNLARFAIENGFDPHDYDALHRWSVAEKGAFWRAVWDFTGVEGDPGAVSLTEDEGHPMTGARFFPAARINLAENLLKGEDNQLAIIEADETGHYQTFTMQDLRDRVTRVSRGLRELGVTENDCVAGILPNRLDGLVALLATAALGATWSSCSPDFGTVAILDRIGQIKPKVLFAAGVYRYGGKDHDITARLAEICAAIPSLTDYISCGEATDIAPPDGIRSHHIASFGSTGALEFTRVPFRHPCYVLYTSGTTGAPMRATASTASSSRTIPSLVSTPSPTVMWGSLRRESW